MTMSDKITAQDKVCVYSVNVPTHSTKASACQTTQTRDVAILYIIENQLVNTRSETVNWLNMLKNSNLFRFPSLLIFPCESKQIVN